ncbi:MAG: hypothetical protein P4M11_02785 [Candidatus Pacebacteria bacterium]|nr:hypothetical protein [Candidatus Paceibacterota bacterium]
MTGEDVERLFRFEAKYGRRNPASYISTMFSTIFNKTGSQTVSIDELK